MTTPREPLTPEERALAQRLARAPGPREPGPALDARILAAARAAVDHGGAEAPPGQPVTDSTPASPPVITPPRATGHARPRPARRWTLGFGVAASLVVAVTIAWQLRPQQSTQRVYESAQAPAADASPPVSAQDQAAPGAAPARSKPLPPAPEAPDVLARPAPLEPPAAPKVAMTPAPVPPATLRKEAPRVREVAPPPAVEPQRLYRVDTYTPPAPPAPPAPAPPPPPPAPGAAADSNASAARAAAATLARTAQSKRAEAQEGAPAAVEQLRSAQEAASANYASPAVPPQIPGPVAERAATPVTVTGTVRREIEEDRRLPPEQWLRAIRKHRFEGDSALARASLQAFQQAHPDMPVPEDLRPLLP